jgi:hypothetical protein
VSFEFVSFSSNILINYSKSIVLFKVDKLNKYSVSFLVSAGIVLNRTRNRMVVTKKATLSNHKVAFLVFYTSETY